MEPLRNSAVEVHGLANILTVPNGCLKADAFHLTTIEIG